MSTTIRVSDETRDRLAALAKAAGRPMSEVVAEALDALERRAFFDALNARYRELRADASTWADVQAERAAEEATVRDASG